MNIGYHPLKKRVVPIMMRMNPASRTNIFNASHETADRLNESHIRISPWKTIISRKLAAGREQIYRPSHTPMRPSSSLMPVSLVR